MKLAGILSLLAVLAFDVTPVAAQTLVDFTHNATANKCADRHYALTVNFSVGPSIDIPEGQAVVIEGRRAVGLHYKGRAFRPRGPRRVAETHPGDACFFSECGILPGDLISLICGGPGSPGQLFYFGRVGAARK